MKQKIILILIGISLILNLGVISLFIFEKETFQGIEMVTQKEIIKDNTTVNINNLENQITKLVEDISPSVVSIVVKKDLTIYRSDPFGFFRQPVGNVQRQVGGGTAFFITSDGYLLTNKHVIADENAEYTVITNDGEEYDAKVLAKDPLTDLAVVKIETQKNFTPLEFVSREDSVRIGQFGVAIGNALAEFQNSVSLGLISGKNRTIEAEGEKISGLLQTDAAINPGNSGGPLINLNGKVMGINTAIVSGSQGIGFSIELSRQRVNFILDSVQEYGEIKRPFIGINYMVMNPQLQKSLGISYDYGAYVIDKSDSVLEGSSAQQSGIEPGDILLEIDGKKLDRNNDLMSVIQNRIPGDRLGIKLLKKNGDIKNIQLTLGKGE